MTGSDSHRIAYFLCLSSLVSFPLLSGNRPTETYILLRFYSKEQRQTCEGDPKQTRQASVILRGTNGQRIRAELRNLDLQKRTNRAHLDSAAACG